MAGQLLNAAQDCKTCSRWRAPSFLRANCSISSFGITKFAVNVRSPDTNKNANKADRLQQTFARVFNVSPKNKESS